MAPPEDVALLILVQAGQRPLGVHVTVPAKVVRPVVTAALVAQAVGKTIVAAIALHPASVPKLATVTVAGAVLSPVHHPRNVATPPPARMKTRMAITKYLSEKSFSIVNLHS